MLSDCDEKKKFICNKYVTNTGNTFTSTVGSDDTVETTDDAVDNSGDTVDNSDDGLLWILLCIMIAFVLHSDVQCAKIMKNI